MTDSSFSFVQTHCQPDECLPDLTDTLIDWCDCNSGSHHLPGLAAIAGKLEAAIAPLADETRLLTVPPARDIDPLTGKTVETPVGQVLQARKRPEAPIQVLLNGHMDTVYGPEHPFQKCTIVEGQRLHGPGVADMKGGLLVMMQALAVLEQHPAAANLGWEVLIGADEEIGSPGTASLFAEAARRNDFGLIYESSPPGGSLVRSRMGSGYFLARVVGESVHVGKNFSEGRNAIEALSAFVLEIQQLNDVFAEARFNTGRISGGGALNAVPDQAHARFNIRIGDVEEGAEILRRIDELRRSVETRCGVSIHWHGQFNRPPKNPDSATTHLYQALAGCGKVLGQDLPWHDTGGGADGSNLLALGLPNIDSLGVVGAELHSPREYMELSSLCDRIQLSALFLIQIASGEINVESIIKPPNS